MQHSSQSPNRLRSVRRSLSVPVSLLMGCERISSNQALAVLPDSARALQRAFRPTGILPMPRPRVLRAVFDRLADRRLACALLLLLRDSPLPFQPLRQTAMMRSQMGKEASEKVHPFCPLTVPSTAFRFAKLAHKATCVNNHNNKRGPDLNILALP